MTPAKETLHSRHIKMMDKGMAFLVDVVAKDGLPFDMRDFRADETGPRYKHHCGTAGCAIGWFPAAGVSAKLGEEWHGYSVRVSGLPYYSDEWKWIFGSNWDRTDNTPEGAAARWYWLRDKGLPENWRKQMFGHAPLCYRTTE